MNTLLRQTSAKHATWHVAARKLSQHPLLLMLGFALGYYLAGRIGLMLRLPPLEISVIWPANAVLLAALMLLPPSRWWLVFLALVPAQLALQAPLGTPAWRIFSQIATNSLLGLGIAAMVLRFTNNAGTFTTLRYTLIYLAVVIIWPALIALISAAVVLWSGAATDFWLSWRQTWLSNTLSFLALVPALVLGLAHGLWLRPGSWRRIAEAVMLFVGLVLLAGFAFRCRCDETGILWLVAVSAIAAAYFRRSAVWASRYKHYNNTCSGSFNFVHISQ